MPLSPLLLLANERPLINVDVTLFVNLGVWAALFFILRAVLWRPMLDLIDAREAGTEGARSRAAALDVEAKELKAKLTAALAAARAAATSDRDALRAEGAKRDAEITAKVREEVHAAVEKQRAELAAQRKAVRAEVAGVIPALAAEIASKVLRREVRS